VEYLTILGGLAERGMNLTERRPSFAKVNPKRLDHAGGHINGASP
jgi:hypothetical protein